MDERTTRGWGSGTGGSGPESRYVPRNPTVVPRPPDSREEPDNSVAATTQSGYQPDIVFIVKRDGSILFVNRSDPGSAEASALGRSMFEYIATEFETTVRQVLEGVFEGGEPGAFVCYGSPPLATGAWYHCRVAPNRRDSGVVSATVIARDITRWKRNEDEFRADIEELKAEIAKVSAEKDELATLLADHERREQELTRFRRIMDQAGEAIFITDPSTGQFVDVNDTACRWLGQSREKLLKMGVNDLDLDFPLESPDGISDHVTNTRDANRPSVYDSGSHRRRNGTSFPVEVALTRRRFGEREYMLVVARDVKKRRSTEQALRESEDKYRSLFDLSRDAIYCSARDGTVADVNDSAIDLFGYTRAEFVGMEARRLYTRAEDIRAFQRDVEANGSTRDLTVEFQTKSGRTFHGLLAATLRTDGDGNVQGYQCIISPVGEGVSRSEPHELSGVGLQLPAANRVVVMGHDKWILDDARTVLERAGIEALCARTAAAAVEILRSQYEDIGAVLLDLNADDPELQHTVDRIREINPAVRIILFQEGDGNGEVTVWADAVVRKPLHPLALAQQVRESLAASRGNQQLS